MGKDEKIRPQLANILPYLQNFLTIHYENERGKMTCLWACGELITDPNLATKWVNQHSGVSLLFGSIKDSPSMPTPLSNNCKEYALAAIGKLTRVPNITASVGSEKKGLEYVLQLLSQPISEGVTQRSLQILANVCTTVEGKSSVQQANDSYSHISSLLPNPKDKQKSVDSNTIFFTLRLLNNLIVSDDDIEKYRNVPNGFEKIFSVLMNESHPTNVRAESLILISNILSDDFFHPRFVKVEGIQVLLKLLQSNTLEYKRDSAKAIANMSIYFDEIRQYIFTHGGAGPLVEMLAYNHEELQYQALRALTNLALSYKYASELVRLGVLNQLMRFINSESKHKATALKLFVNLTNNDKARPHVTKAIGNLTVCTNLLDHKDPVVQLSAVKLITNLTTQGQNRKWMNENKAHLQTLKKMQSTSSNPEIKKQAEVALANVSFPYEDRYIDESMMTLPELIPLADDQQENELKKKEEEEKDLEKDLEDMKRKMMKAKVKAEAIRSQMVGWNEQDFKKLTLDEKKKALDSALIKLHSAEKNSKRAKQNVDSKQQELDQTLEFLSKSEQQALQAKVKRAHEKLNAAKEFQQWCEDELKRLEKWINNLNIQEDKKKEAERLQKLKKEEEIQKKLEQEALKKVQEGERKLQLLGQQRIKGQEELAKKRATSQQQLPSPPSRPLPASTISKSSNIEVLTEEQKKLNQRRTNIAREIYDTEKSYMDSMNVLLWKFQKPLEGLAMSSGGTKSIISRDEIKTLFSDVEIIVNFNTLILDGLSNRLSQWDPSKTKISDIFISINSFLKCYVEYVNNYNDSMSLLGKLVKRNPKFETFIAKVEKTPETRGLDLQSFLIMPVQRIPRYVMLLADLLKHTPQEHPDHQGLSLALSKMKETGDHINEKKRESENLNKLMEIERSLQGLTILEPWRRFVSEHSVILFKKDLKTPRNAHLHIFNDLVIVSYPKKIRKTLNFMVKASFAISQTKALRESPTKGHSNLFSLGGIGIRKVRAGDIDSLFALPDRSSSDTSRHGSSFYFDLQASSEAELTKIMETLQNSSRDSMRRETTFQSFRKSSKIDF